VVLEVVVVVESVVVGLALVATLLRRAPVLAWATHLAVAAFVAVVTLWMEASWVDFCLAQHPDHAVQYLTAVHREQRKVAASHSQAEVLAWAPAVEPKAGAS